METVVIKSDKLSLPDKIAKKLKGKKFELVEIKDGIMLKLLEDPIKDARGSLRGSNFSSKRYMQLKKEEKELER